MDVDGRQVAAARALAGLTVRDLADAANTTKRVISKIETGGPVRIAKTRRWGHISADLWERIQRALAARGVELIDRGARWRPNASDEAP